MKSSGIYMLLGISSILLLNGCRQMDSPVSQTITVQEDEEYLKETMADLISDEPAMATASVPVIEPKVSIEKYSGEKISFEYPVLSQIEDTDRQEILNTYLYSNIMLDIADIIKTKNPEHLNLTCSVISLDRKRLTVIYKGDFQTKNMEKPKNVFYSNTLDLIKLNNIGLNDYLDPYTLAQYIMSDDCELYMADKQTELAFSQYKNTKSISYFTELFQAADYSVTTNDFSSYSSDLASFSYEDKGTIFISVPVPSDMGDYVLVSYTPDTK